MKKGTETASCQLDRRWRGNAALSLNLSLKIGAVDYVCETTTVPNQEKINSIRLGRFHDFFRFLRYTYGQTFNGF